MDSLSYKKAILKPYTSQVVENGVKFMGTNLYLLDGFRRRMNVYGIENAMGSIMNFDVTPQGEEYWNRFYVFHF